MVGLVLVARIDQQKILFFASLAAWAIWEFAIGNAYGESENRAKQAYSSMTVEGFGEMQFAYLDYPEFFTLDRKNGPQRDQRFSVGISRFDVGIERSLAHNLSCGLEVEFEHQGVELHDDPNFYGPFSDDDHDRATEGGVTLSKLYFAKKTSEHARLYLGRYPVAIGLLANTKNPTDYLGTNPFESEVNMIPSNWTEYGVTFDWTLGWLRSTSQLITGLDSSGFGSRQWVAGGRQGRFGDVTASDMAMVERVDILFGRSAKAGAAVYYGDTSRNRPTADLANACSDTDKVAACGYIHTPMTIADMHAQINAKRVRTEGLILWGFIHNADQINLANAANQTNLPARYSPVASKAAGASVEFGYNLAQDSKNKIEPYIKYDHYNTMYTPASDDDGSALFERRVITAGLSYLDSSSFYAKGDYARRTFGAREWGYETEVTMSSGFLF